MATREERNDYFEQLIRIAEFKEWVNTNVLWPHVPDTIVTPLMQRLMEAEKILFTEVGTSPGGLERLLALKNAKTKVK
jgi:hypothetical protein